MYLNVRSLVIFVGVFMLAIVHVATAQQRLPTENTELDRQAALLYQQVMSPFCPGRALGDCPSSKAHDLKAEMRQKLEAGIAPEKILEEVFSKYGDQYRAVPGFSGFALLAWVVPIIFLIAGLLLALRLAGARRAHATRLPGNTDADITESEQREIDEELARID